MIAHCSFCLNTTNLENFNCLLCKNHNYPLGKFAVPLCKNCIEKHMEFHLDFKEESHMGTHYKEPIAKLQDIADFL